MTRKEYNELLNSSHKKEDKKFSLFIYISCGVGFIAGMAIMAQILFFFNK